MAASWWEEMSAQETGIRKMGQERERIQAFRAGASADLAQRIGALHNDYSHLGPGVSLSLAKTGVRPDEPVAKLAAAQAAKRRARKGVGWHTIGEAVGTIGRTGATVLKPVARNFFTAAMAPVEMLQGEFRNLARDIGEIDDKGFRQAFRNDEPDQSRKPWEPAQGFEQTTAYQALPESQGGAGRTLGTGYMPGSEAAAAQSEAARAAYMVDGHAGTPGRVLARIVSQPGSAPYNILSGMVDFSVSAFGDPGAFALSSMAKARKTSKLFVADDKAIRDAAGLVGDAHRPDVITKRADEWLGSSGGRRALQYMADDTEFYSLYKRFGDKVPPEVLIQVADAQTAEDVAHVLRPALGIDVRAKPNLGGPAAEVRFGVRRSLDEVRLTKVMPGAHTDLDDIADSVSNLDRYLSNVKAPTELKVDLMDRMARAIGRNGRYGVWDEAFAETTTHLMTETGLPKLAARRLTQWKKNYDEELARYFVDEVGENMPVLGATINGAGKALPTPHLYNELINRTLSLPDARDLRRATSTYGRIINAVPGADTSIALLDSVQGIWKRLALMRGAYTVRVLGEEQVRMGASELDSLVRHPIAALAWITGRRGDVDMAGNAFEDAAEFARAQSSRGSPEWWRQRKVYAGKRLVDRDDPDFAKALGDELSRLHADPVARRVGGGWDSADQIPGGLTGNHVDDAQRWFWEGDGKAIRMDMGSAPGRAALRLDRAEADRYIESIWQRIEVKTGGVDELRGVVANGHLGADAIRKADKLSKPFVRFLEDLSGEGALPDVAVGDRLFDLGSTDGSKVAQSWDKATETIFNVLMTVPTNKLSRSVAFRQYYWQRAEELLPTMGADARALLLASAEEAGLDAKTLRRLRQIASTPEGKLGIADADRVTKAFALDSTRELLYDLTEKGQFTDIARHFFPFGEAWKEVLTRWATIGSENPAVFRRAQMAVRGAREADPFNDGHGIFYTDPQTGEETFAFPGSEFVTEKTIGAPVGFKGSVAGLSLFSSNPLMPGFGPIAQMAASKILPETPDWDWARGMIMPYGETDPEKRGGIAEAFMPAWFQKWRQAYSKAHDSAQFANTFAGSARYLASTGDYDLNDADDVRRLEDDAKALAKRVFVIRGMAQFFAPTAPSPEFMAADKDGKTMSQFLMTDRYRKLLKEDFHTATERFIAEFGEKNLLAMQSTTEGKGPVTGEALTWIRDNPDLARKFPETYYLFAPAGGEFNYAAYQHSLDTGERRVLPPAEWLASANHRVGNMIYHSAKDKLPPKPTPAQTQWLRDIKTDLRKEYPGYDSLPRDDNRTERLVREVISAMDDPRIADSDAGAGVALYLVARTKALDAARKLKLTSFGTAKGAKHLRTWLREIAADLMDEHPDFKPIFEQVLSNEMVEDDD